MATLACSLVPNFERLRGNVFGTSALRSSRIKGTSKHKGNDGGALVDNVAPTIR